MDSSSSSTDNVLKLLAWLDKNKQKVSLIAAGVVAVVGLIAAVIYYQSQKEVRASEALSDVRKSYNPATAKAESPEAYLKIARDFDGTKAAGRALLEAAAIYYAVGGYTNAEAQYKRFLNEYPESAFQQQGMLGLAATLDAQGKTTDAIAKYEELRRRFPSDSVIDETKLALARLYEKSNPAEAYKLYSELSAAGSQSGIGAEAGIRLADLVEKHPELAKVNTPPPAPTPAPVPKPLMLQGFTNRPSGSNQVVLSMTNLQNQPSTTITIPAPTPTATGATSPTPLLLKPPTISTNVSTNKP